MSELGRRLLTLLQYLSTLSWLRHVWTVAALGIAAWFLAAHREEIFAERLRWEIATSAFLLTGCGKFFSALHVQSALAICGERLALAPSLYAYSLSDASKYIPGFVWSVVSRVGLYRALLLPGGIIARTLVVEQVWYIGAAAMTGLALYLGGRWHAWPLAVLMLSAWAACLFLLNRRMPAPAPSETVFRLFAVQLCQWILLGAGFAVLLPPEVPQAVAMGAFLIAFAAGMAVPFAPGGLGVRELALLFLLLPFQSPAAIGYEVLMSRAIWVGADILFTLLIVFSCRRAWSAAVAAKSCRAA